MKGSNKIAASVSAWSRMRMIAALFLFAYGVTAMRAQTAPEMTQGQQPSRPQQDAKDNSALAAGSASFDGQQESLPAEQIIEILQQNPDAAIEVKSLVSQALQQKGVAVPPDSISDEQLDSQITSNSELRANISHFLRSRGYVSEDDLQRPSSAGAAAKGDGAEPLAMHVSSDSPLSDAADLGPESATAEPGTRRESAVPVRSPSSVEAARRTRNITDEPDALRRPVPYNLRSLRDLYSQVPDREQHLQRFGSDVFITHGNAGAPPRSNLLNATIPLDIPLGPDYVLGPGDDLSITMWGGLSQTLTRPVDREGRITLPEAGQIQVAGLTLERAQSAISSALQPQFRNSHVAVTVARLRTIRIYVVGDVQRPGAYDISSLASPLTALCAAGGPTAIGSLRVIHQFRNDKLINEIDLYDFLLHGIRQPDERLQGGDTLLVLPVGPQVAVSGAVKRPAIYELHNEKNLAAVLDDAGGMTVAAELGHVTVERIVANHNREELSLNPAASDDAARVSVVTNFAVQDGDRVRVATVLPYNERVVYLQGHVSRPGKIGYHDGLHLSEIIETYRDLLPEPAARGEIVRLVAPDLHPDTIDFSVPELLIGNSDIALQPFDTVRIFGRYEQDAPMVSVRGEVLRPGSYPLFDGMTATQLVRAAGGFKRDALLDDADLISYNIVNGTGVTIQRRDLNIGAAVSGQDPQADARLKPGDILTIHQLTGWTDIGASIKVEGEVAHPGSYGFTEGEHLSDILKRAGGFREGAYPEGAVLTRPEVAALEEKSRSELIRQIESSSAAARLSPGVAGGDASTTLQVIQQQQQQVLGRLRSQPASGRLVIRISSDLNSWAGTAADIEVRRGDVLRVPKRPGFVLVSGQVYNASAITFSPGKTAGWYLQRAGGATEIANRKKIFVIRASGAVVGRRSGGWYDRDVLSTKLDPGDVIVVPQKIIGSSLIWRNLLGTAQIAASIAIAAAVAGL